RGFATEDQVTKAMELSYRVPYVDLKNHASEANALKSVPADVAEAYQIVPLSLKEKQLTVAMADPEDVMTVAHLQKLTGCKIRVVFSHPEEVKKAVKEHYAANASSKLVQTPS